VLITWFSLQAVNGEGALAALRDLRAAHPEKFNSLGGANSSVPWHTLLSGVLLLNLFYWTTNQQIIQRALAARSLREGQRGVLIAGVFKVLAPIVLVLPGIIAFHLYAKQGLKPDDAYGTLVSRVLPPWLTGFFAAVIAGAILSSFNSVLNSTATLFCLGFHRTGPGAAASDDARLIRRGKIVGTVAAVFAMIAAPLLAGQDSIFGYLQRMNALYFIPIFAVVLAGLLFRRAPAWAASTALVAGCAILLLGYFVPPFSVWATRVHGFHFIGLVFAALMLFQFLASVLAPRAEPWEHRASGDVDLTPWRWAKPVGYGLVAFVGILYLAFADFSVLGG
jgi:SSS family solute:Na+ symporter